MILAHSYEENGILQGFLVAFFENQGENKVYGGVCQIKLCMSSHFMANAPTGIRNQ